MAIKNVFYALKDLIKGRNLVLLLSSIVVGFVWFMVEFSFVFIMQAFLYTIGVLPEARLNLPSWIPLTIESSMMAFVVFGFLRALLIYLKSILGYKLQYNFIHEWRLFFLKVNLDNSSYSTGQYISFFNEKINQSGLFIQNLSLLIVSLLVSFFFLIISFKIAPLEMFFCLTLLVLLMLPVKLKSQEIHKIGESILKNTDKTIDEITIIKKNIFLLKVYNKLNSKTKELAKVLESIFHKQMHYANNFSVLISIPVFLGIFILGLCSYFSVKYFHTEGIVLLSFFYIFLRFSVGISELNHYNALLKLNYAGFMEVFDFKKNYDIHNIQSQQDQTPLKTLHPQINKLIDIHKIEIKNLSFSYAKNTFDPHFSENKTDELLNNINLQISKGDLLVIQGPSGSGKSSLIKLILGLETPTQGDVLIDGHSVRALDSDWKSIIGYVGPEPYMIRGTLRDNLLFGLNQQDINLPSDQELNQALTKVNLLDELQKLGLSLDSHLDEIAFLSTGQKQRLSIARNILRRAKLLILDEATANLDKANEALIFNYINEYKKDAIVILITHQKELTHYATQTLNL